MILFSVEELSPRLKWSGWSNPAIFAVGLAAFKPLILLESALLALSALEKPDPLDATETKLLAGLPRRMSRLDRKLSKMAVDRLVDLVEASEVDALVGDSAAEVTVEAVDDVKLLVEPSMRFPDPAAKLRGRLSVEDVAEVVEAALVDILGDDSTVHSSFIMVSALIDAAVEFSLGMFLLLELSVFVVMAVVAPGSPLMFVLSIARCENLGLL